MKRYEHAQQSIGRWTVFVRGDMVIMQTTVEENGKKRLIERNLSAEEALVFIAWLFEQKNELYQAVAKHEREEVE